MRLVRLLPITLLFVPANASAQSMNAETFYQKAVVLKRKGPLALFSSDLKPLMREGQAAGKAASASRKAALGARKTPRYCPPVEVEGMSQTEFLDRLGRIPAAERRRIDIGEATNRLLAAKFPCPA